MILNITQAASKYFVVGLVLCAISACSSYTPPIERTMTQLEWRQLQTKTYSVADELVVMKAVLAAFQDSGYNISSTSIVLGLITAQKKEQIDGGCVSISNPSRMPYCVIAIDEVATTTITKIGKNETRVRISIQKNGLTDSNGIEWTRKISDALVYKDLFSKVDKAIFLQQENL